MSTRFLSIALWCISLTIYAQEPESTVDQVIQERVAFAAEQSDQEIDLAALTEIYWQYLQSPIPLTAEYVQQIEQLQILTLQQSIALNQHLTRYGALLALEELQAVPYFDLRTIYLLLPFITTRTTQTKWSLKNPKHNLIFRSNYTVNNSWFPNNDTSTIGEDIKHYLRYRLFTEKIQLGMNAESDAGEAFFNHGTGFDFYSGFIAINQLGAIKQVIVGDYQVMAGQGLNIWTGFGFSKTNNSQLVAKNESHIRPYASGLESNYFRGAAMQIEKKGFTFSPFYINRKADANITDTLSGELIASSIEGSGLHRTPNELTRKNKAHLHGYGFNVSKHLGGLRFGVSMLNYAYDVRLNADESFYESALPEKLNKLQRWSIHGLWSGSYGLWFGEVAYRLSGKKALFLGTTQAIGDQVSATLAYRNIDFGFGNVYNLSFADGNGENEQGYYLGLAFTPNINNKIDVYIDQYQSKWLRRFSPTKNQGIDVMAKWKYEVRRKWLFYTLIRHNKETPPVTIPEETFKHIIPEVTQYIRLHFEKNIHENWGVHLRYQQSFHRQQFHEKGWLCYQELLYQRKKFKLALRYTLFNTPSFNSRIYVYERTVLYSFQTPAYFGVGSTFYILGKVKLGNHLNAWLRCSKISKQTLFSLNEQNPSSPNRFLVHAQLQFTF